MEYTFTQPIVLDQKDFSEEIFWTALCESLDIPYDSTSISIEVAALEILKPEIPKKLKD